MSIYIGNLNFELKISDLGKIAEITIFTPFFDEYGMKFVNNWIENGVKIRMLIETRYYQINPKLMWKLYNLSNYKENQFQLKWVNKNESRFHGKLTSLKNEKDNEWVIIGSSNFTRAGLEKNNEINTLFKVNDPILQNRIKNTWEGKVFSVVIPDKNEINIYENYFNKLVPKEQEYDDLIPMNHDKKMDLLKKRDNYRLEGGYSDTLSYHRKRKEQSKKFKKKMSIEDFKEFLLEFWSIYCMDKRSKLPDSTKNLKELKKLLYSVYNTYNEEEIEDYFIEITELLTMHQTTLLLCGVGTYGIVVLFGDFLPGLKKFFPKYCEDKNIGNTIVSPAKFLTEINKFCQNLVKERLFYDLEEINTFFWYISKEKN